MPLKPAGFLRPGGHLQTQITGRPRTSRLTRHSGSIEHYRCLASRRSRLWYYYRPLSRGASLSGLPTQDRILFSEPTIFGLQPPHRSDGYCNVVAIFTRTLVTSVARHGAAGATGYLGLNREAPAGDGDRFRRVRKADTPRPARCTAPRSSASLAGRPEGHSQGTNEKGLNCASAR